MKTPKFVDQKLKTKQHCSMGNKPNIPALVINHLAGINGRNPETNDEWDYTLDIILHMEEYAEAVENEKIIGRYGMKILGLKTKEEIKKEWAIANSNNQS